MNKLTQLASATVLALGVLAAGPAAAAYTVGHIGDDYGSAEINSDGIVLYGSNNSAIMLQPTTVTVTDTMSFSGTVTFNWVYEIAAFPDYDPAGYILNGSFNKLSNWSDVNLTGVTSVAVNAGDVFGFYVSGDNDMFGSRLTITDLVYTSAVPEPSSLALMVAGLAGLPLLRRRRSGQ